MNVFLCCLQSDRDYAIAPYKFWRENFKPALEAMGHRVLEPQGLDFAAPLANRNDAAFVKRYRAETSQTVLRQVREAHQARGVDLFLSYFYTAHVLPDAIAEIGRLGIPTVNFFTDNMREFHSVSALVNSFTLNWVPEKDACALYQKRKAPFIYLPMAANPEFYRTEPGVEIPQVTFVGGADHLRVRLMADALAGGLPLKVYGRGWVGHEDGPSSNHAPQAPRPGFFGRRRVSLNQHMERVRVYGITGELRHLGSRGTGRELLEGFQDAFYPPVSHPELLRLGANSSIFLGINRCPSPGYPLDRPLVYSRLRDIEGPMMGACLLTEHCSDVAELYEIGSEVAVYRTSDELVAEAQRLMRDAPSRKRLRERGHAAALARHTWQRRFEVLFRTLGLKVEAGATHQGP